MPIGYLITVVLMAVLTFCAVGAPTPRRPRRSRLRHWLGFMINELPAIGLCWLVASTVLAWSEGELANPVDRAALALAGATALGPGLAAWWATRGSGYWTTAGTGRTTCGRTRCRGS